MDPKHKELLEQCQQKLSESVTDVDRVLELLAQSGSLSPAERAELDKNCSSGAEKVHLLLKTLAEKKERDHFQEFCWALEKTQPVLLSALLPANNHHSTGKTSEPPAEPAQCSRVSFQQFKCYLTWRLTGSTIQTLIIFRYELFPTYRNSLNSTSVFLLLTSCLLDVYYCFIKHILMHDHILHP